MNRTSGAREASSAGDRDHRARRAAANRARRARRLVCMAFAVWAALICAWFVIARLIAA